MQDHQQNGQRFRKSDPGPSALDGLSVGALVALTAGGVLLITGLVGSLNNGYKVGAYASFGWGLTSVIVAATLLNGGIALLCHRSHASGRAKMNVEIRELNRNVRTIVATMNERSEADDDQVGAARRSHEN